MEDWLGLALFSSAGFLSSWHILLRSYTFSSYPFLVSRVSSPVLVVHLYTTGISGRKCHTLDYTRCVVIHFMVYTLLILSICGCFMYWCLLHGVRYTIIFTISRAGIGRMGWHWRWYWFFRCLFLSSVPLFSLFFFPFSFFFFLFPMYPWFICQSERDLQSDRRCNGYMLGLDVMCRLIGWWQCGRKGGLVIRRKEVWTCATVGLRWSWGRYRGCVRMGSRGC